MKFNLDDYENYQDHYGLITPSRGSGPSHNGARYTAEMLMAADFHGYVFELYDWHKYAHLFVALEKHSGVLRRLPDTDWGGLDSIDNVIGALYADFALDTKFAARFLEHGETSTQDGPFEWEVANRVKWNRLAFNFFGPFKYHYNHIAPNKLSITCWMGRFPAAMCMAQWIAGRVPSIFSRLAFYASILWGVLDRHQDSKSQTAMMVQVAWGRDKLTDIICHIYVLIFRKRFPDGLGKVLGDWMNDHTHPNSKHLKGFHSQRINHGIR